ncbi:MAG TPA: TRAP transporter substrate-binding protein [Gammaproteobacteria bacterium]|nr:TRAP transporter substrate-binding protein [Gammaproteobacteria bacterium]
MNMKWKRGLVAAAIAASVAVGGVAQAAEVHLRVVGNFSGNKKQVDGVERPFFKKLDERDDLKVTYNTMDAIGVDAANALRLIRAGAFDIMSVQIGMASRDDPFFEGVDLAGVAQDLDEQRKVVDAYREAFDQRLQQRFNAKLLALWPFGPQVLFCKGDIKSTNDLKGKKIRVFTPSMSRLVEGLGGTPVTLQFSEVYLALQRGVADCGVTAPTAGNSGKWPEVTDHLVPLPLSYSVQGHFMNLNTWKRLSPQQQQELTAEFAKMEQAMWDIARNVNDDAIACSTGGDCNEHEQYKMTLVGLGADSKEQVRAMTEQQVLPVWANTCNSVWSECAGIWNGSVGKATSYEVKAK